MKHFSYSSRFNEFGVDGGPAAKSLKPKFDVFSKHVKTQSGLQFPHVDVRSSYLLNPVYENLRDHYLTWKIMTTDETFDIGGYHHEISRKPSVCL